MEGETVNHVLFSCPVARQVWALTGVPASELGFQNCFVFSNIHYLLRNRTNRDWPDELRKYFPWILGRIW